ncbi:MAG: Type I restriction-modification system, specificity subunit S [Nitrospira sp.]|jgi:type I restriction enzyme S subunit|nr:Type I restriction-modification system, specificity subunit S [Nitrospira sp.]
MNEVRTASWRKVILGSLAKKLVNGGTPPTGVERFWNGKIPWVTGADFTSSGIGEFRRFVSEEAVTQTSTNVIERGQLLIVTRTGVGKLAIAPCDIAISQDITGFYVDEDQVTPDFLYHRMRRGIEDLKRLNQGTSINGIVRGDLISYFVELPPLAQQRRIAEILSTVDEAIEQTEALIAKYQQIKAGLMHDLFTRGVMPDGQLRPTRAQAPHLYKESPLGWIPKEWDCFTVEELLEKSACPMRSGPFGSALLKNELVNEGIPLLGIDNIYQERFVPTFSRFVSYRKFTELMRYSVLPRDVIITIMGTVGRCCVVPDSVTQALSSKHLWTMTFDNNRVLPDLVCWQLNHARWVKDWFARYSQGAVMEAIQSSTLRTLRLPVPHIEEQGLIRSRYRSSSHRIDVEQQHLDKLKQIKYGLMHDLLTGRVRVQVPEVAQASAR